MGSIRNGVAACAAAVALVAVSAGCSSQPAGSQAPAGAPTKAGFVGQLAQSGTLVAADSASVKPLKYIENGQSEMQGLIPDLTREYAKRVGLNVQFDKVSSDAVIPGVLANRYDVALAVGDFADRRKTLDFVDLVKGGVVLVVQTGNPASVQGRKDLCGRRLAIVKGSVQQGYADGEQKSCAASGKPAIDIQGYADGPTATLALQSSRVDVEWSDLAVANQMVKDSPDRFQLAGDPELLAPYGVGIPKNKPELRDAILKAVSDMKADGTYDRLLAKWGQANIGLEKIEINGSKF